MAVDKSTSSDFQQQHWSSSYDPRKANAPTLPTKGQIRAIVPNECFTRSYTRALYYLTRDTAMSIGCVYIAYNALSTELPSSSSSLSSVLVWVVGWTTYAFCQGCTITGHWVLAHECGHGAFTPNQSLNDICGFLMHQALLVPYFSWQYTHAKHHRRTNNTMDGESHVPGTRTEVGLDEYGLTRVSNWAVIHEAIGDGPFGALKILANLVVGWPLYLLGVVSTGRLGHDGKMLMNGDAADHYRPWSKMFPTKLRFKVIMSTLGIVIAWIVIGLSIYKFGILPVTLWYIGPLMWNQAWLVLYTWLQHTDPSVPHYGIDAFTWMRGALSTIDRPYGVVLDFFHHNIGSTHVAHHLFSEMPFYKADIATAAIKSYLDPLGLYNYDPTPWYLAMWRIAKQCHYIDGLGGIQYFKSFGDVPIMPYVGKKLD